MNAKVGVIVVLLLAAVGGGGWYYLKLRPAGTNGGGTPGAAGGVRVVARALAESSDTIVDPIYGKVLFEKSCASCHGFEGRGDGPAARYIWRRPADLTDASYVGTRSDEDLYAVITDGGKQHERAVLMPQWQTFYNHYERLDLVAYVRALAPDLARWLPGAARRARIQSVLPPAVADPLKTKLAAEAPFDSRVDHTVNFVRAFDGPDPNAKVIGHAIFADVDCHGRKAILCIAVGADLKITATGTHEELLFGEKQSLDGFFGQFKGADEAALTGGKGWTPVAGAEVTCTLLAAQIRKHYLRLLAGIAQDADDWKAVAAKKAAGATDPKEKLYLEACASCHGVLGNVKGIVAAATIQPWPRNFLDGVYMNQPEITRDYLVRATKIGGIATNISSTMPSYGKTMSEADINAIVDYILTLPIPKKQ